MKTIISKSEYGFTVIKVPLGTDHENWLSDTLNRHIQVPDYHIRYYNVLPYNATGLYEYIKSKYDDICIINVAELDVTNGNEQKQFKQLFKYICKHDKKSLIFIDSKRINDNQGILSNIFSKYMMSTSRLSDDNHITYIWSPSFKLRRMIKKYLCS